MAVAVMHEVIKMIKVGGMLKSVFMFCFPDHPA
jgi:hypothetical protein